MNNECSDLFQRIHLFLLSHVDGNNADRLVSSTQGTVMDMTDPIAVTAFTEMPCAEQIKCIVNYWATQYSMVTGINHSVETINMMTSVALRNFDEFLWMIHPTIEEFDLPRVPNRGVIHVT